MKRAWPRNAEDEADNDAEPMARIAHGELGALGTLYDRHYLPVLRFVQRATRNAPEAEDIAQEVFLTASRVAGTYDGRPSCLPWLFGIAARHVLHLGRGAARLARFRERFRGHWKADASCTPHDTLVQSELGNELASALMKLSVEKRMTILLAEVEGLTSEEIARVLDIPKGTVWTRLHHARRELRKSLERNRS